MAKYRFQDLVIWQMAIEITEELFTIADKLERMKLYRFSDQLRGSGLGMSNTIAEGSGSGYNKIFYRYLDYARSSTFENANITIVLQGRGIIKKEKEIELLDRLDHLSRKITNFQKTL